MEEDATHTVASSTTTATPTPPAPRSGEAINIGVDPLRTGLNPHLVADDSTFVRSLASLVLPSAFRDGQMDTDVLVSAEEIGPSSPTAVQTVRYVISPAAQWSDGTPLTGADFRYLWRGMRDTPGVIDPAGYRSISDIRVSAAGRTVDVNFHQPVVEWRGLFANLLPSHLLQADGSDFTAALQQGIPASAGRYMVQAVDRPRGMLTINRNDRFWGQEPAETDLVTFRAVRSVTQGVDQLRSGQLSYLDTTPAETSVDSYSLMVDTQVRVVDHPRELQLTMSTTSPLLGQREVRAELSSLIDVPLVARLAAGRSADLRVAEHTPTGEEAALLRDRSADHPLRLAADPTDDTASAAVRTLVDLLAQHGVAAEIVSTDLHHITGVLLPRGEVDAVLAWNSTQDTAVSLASRHLCPPAGQAPRSGNLSGYCSEETDELLRAVLAGEAEPEVALALSREINETEHLMVPLLGERRVVALGQGIVGPDPDLDNWTAGIPTVATWRKQ